MKTHEPKFETWPKLKKIHLTEAAAEWLEGRNVPAELAVQYGVCSARDEKGREDWIAFRNKHEGEVVHESYRSIGPQTRYRQSSETTRTLWNSECLKDETLAGEPLLVIEGHMDALVALACGYAKSTSIPDGAPTPPKKGREAERTMPTKKYDWVEIHKEDLKKCEEIILLGDGDGPGALLVQDLAIRLGKKRCKWVAYPEGCKDLSDVRKEFGVDGVRDLIDAAKWMPVSGIYRLNELPYEPPEVPLKIGIPGLDDLWRVVFGRMTIVTGPPSHGKSQLIADALCNLAYNHDLVIAMASFEDRIRAMLVPRLLRWYLGCNPEFASIDAYEQAMSWVHDHFIFIQPDEEDDEPETATWYMDRMETAVRRFNAKIGLLDPFNELDQSDRFKEDTENDYIGDTLKRFRRHAKHWNYHTVIAAHPKKINDEKGGKVRIPGGYDISGSSHWFNKTDSGLTVFRDFEANTTLVRCWKAKSQGIIGEPGDRMFRYLPEAGRYQYAPDLQEVEIQPSEWQRKSAQHSWKQ